MISSYILEYFIGIAILAITALVAPYISELIKRKMFAPKLNIIFFKESPYITEPSEDEGLYLLCFEVKNKGNSKAKNCEIIVEEFCYKNGKGNFIEENKEFPARLGWIYSDNIQIDILPKAGRLLKFFYICSSHDSDPNNKDKLFFEMNLDGIVPFSYGRIFQPLNYLKIKIVIYSENAKKCEQYIEIKSPGIKRDKKEDILQELQIKLI